MQYDDRTPGLVAAGQLATAVMKVAQTQVDGASDRLCQSEGLIDVGLVCTTTL